jgi:mannose-6-phosphate isomerase-like protein (cupin superfamily)
MGENFGDFFRRQLFDRLSLANIAANCSGPRRKARTCDEYLYVFSGKGTFWMDSPANGGAFAPGHFLFFKRGTVHALPEIIEGPVVFLSVDTPRRDPKDIIFVNPEDGTPDSFIQGQKK